MILAHSLLGGNVAEHASLLLIGSSMRHWTRRALFRYTIFDFFSSLLGFCLHLGSAASKGQVNAIAAPSHHQCCLAVSVFKIHDIALKR